ncbi:MAG: hypothetical protein K1X94_11075 [Sandaracinaceae bacterium]|nr:hypothetical protein [Sandaracinaceae bacterium]
MRTTSHVRSRWTRIVACALYASSGCAPRADTDASTTRMDAREPDASIDRDVGVIDAAPASDTGLDAGRDAGPAPSRLTVEVVTDRHRYVPGLMFGGWGPHPGHLVRAAGTLYWVDDVCDQGVPGDCDVNVNRRVGVLRREAGGWLSIGEIPLSGIQQNTGTVATSSTLHTYGVDVASERLAECRFELVTASSSCASIPIATGASANYVGAAISPSGARIAWWTNVRDGGGGTFSYVADYGGGWNGPRVGPIAGYNDFAYAHAGFDPHGPGLVLFGQVVSGTAPSWSFATLVGRASLTTTDAVEFTAALAPPAGTSIASTNDLWIDPRSGDAHLLARAASGAVVYYHQPPAGSWSAPTVLEPPGLRARFLESPTTLALVTGASGGGVHVRRFARDALAAGSPLSFASATDESIALAGIGQVLAIYPEADVTQADDVGALDFAVVGDAQENLVHFVLLE